MQTVAGDTVKYSHTTKKKVNPMADSNKQDSEQPKLIIDDDWKAQAQAEKEQLAQDAEEKPQATPAPLDGEGQDAQPSQRELPPASFSTLVSSMMTQVIFALGGMQDPQSKERYVDLEVAKHHIDTLSVLEEKTSGNLSDDEKNLLDRALYETRMQYVQVAQRMSNL